jgi:hypothetical protein
MIPVAAGKKTANTPQKAIPEKPFSMEPGKAPPPVDRLGHGSRVGCIGHREEGRGYHRHYEVLDPEGEAGADVGDDEEEGEGPQVHQDWGVVGEDPEPSGPKAEDVHDHDQGLADVEGNSDASSHLQA